MTLRTAIPVLLALCALAACKKTDHVPSYLDVQQPSVLITDASQQGTSSCRIPDVWAYANDEALGAWSVPAPIPVLTSGATNIKLIGGVARNGVVNDRVQYPFFETYSTDVDLTLEQHLSVAPQFKYYSNTIFWIEDFEDPGLQFESLGSDTPMVRLDIGTYPELVFEGNASAGIFLDADHDFFRCSNIEPIDIVNTGPVFLELDYRCDHRFLVGAYYTLNGSVVQQAYLYVSSTVRSDGGMPWNKIYIDLSPIMNVAGATEKKLFFEAQLGSGETAAQIYLDNVKVLYR